jgi:methylated-DNA-[protein]-cysteine S-methyltransferase
MNTQDELTTALNGALAATPDHLRRLRERLAVQADTEGILDVAYRTIDSPVGTLLLAATEQGLVRVAFSNENHDAVLQTCSTHRSHPPRRPPARRRGATRRYFLGRRPTSACPSLDTVDRLSQHETATPPIGYGHTASYSAVAELAGNPKAIRAVGTACATNPLPVIIPCHRVVRADGTPGGYLGGTENKRTLLALEAAAA